jgi:predicted PurR-regulated permease PerM
MSTLIALVQGLIPLFPKGIALLPAVAQLALQRHYLGAATIVGTYVYFMNYGVLKIQGTISKHNKYLTGLSIAGGLTLFSPSMEGVFLGPLIMTVLYAAKNLYTEFVLDVHAEYTA